jgi:hypothetical protein
MHLAASSGFHRRPRSRAVAWILPELRRRFHRWQANGFLDALSAVHRAHPVPVASAASKRYSPPEAVARDGRVSPSATARALLGFRPSRAFLRSSLRSFVDPADHSVHRGASTAAPGRATPRRWVRPLRPCGRVGLVGAYRSALRTRTGTCRLSATTLPPTTLEPAVARLPLVLGGSKDSTSDPSARDELLSWDFLPRRRPRDFARRADPDAVSARRSSLSRR